MKLSDYVTLLKGGMKLEEIRAREEQEEDNETNTDTGGLHTDPITDTDILDSGDDSSGDDRSRDKEVEEPDYKALYEQSQKDLKAAQQANVKQNIKDDTDPSDEELFSELVASFM